MNANVPRHTGGLTVDLSGRYIRRLIIGRWIAVPLLISLGGFCLLASVPAAGGEPRDQQDLLQLSLRTSGVLALKGRLERFADALPQGEQMDVREIVAFEEGPLFACVVGKTSGSGGAGADARQEGNTPGVTRRMVFLKPDTLIVDDQVINAGPDRAVRWVLETSQAAELNDRGTRIVEGDREIFCETLLPPRARLKTESRASTGQQGPRHAVEIVASPGPARFLHVLRVRPRDGGRDGAPEIASHEGTLKLKIPVAERTFSLTLPPVASGAGTISAAKADGETLLHRRPLPSGILPHGDEGVKLLERWDTPYHDNRVPGWDVGRPSTELKRMVESETVRPGRAIEFGCGSGTNAIYLAQRGFEVTGLDIAPTALARAEEKAREAGVQVRWLLVDVLAPPELGAFDFVFDRGCYHHVRRYNAPGYVQAVQRLTRPGSRVLILAGNANEEPHYGPPRVKEEELRADFSTSFDFVSLQPIRFDSTDPQRQGPLAWSALLQRK